MNEDSGGVQGGSLLSSNDTEIDFISNEIASLEISLSTILVDELECDPVPSSVDEPSSLLASCLGLSI